MNTFLIIHCWLIILLLAVSRQLFTEMINVTKSYLPDLDEYTKYLKGIWERVHLTNDGPLLRELEEELKAFLLDKVRSLIDSDLKVSLLSFLQVLQDARILNVVII